jgi:hypothetical protein
LIARHPEEVPVRGKQIAISALVALVVVVVYDAAKAKGKVPGVG